MIKVIGNDFDQKKFDSAAINPMQSWAWGETRKSMGTEVLRIGSFSKDELNNVFQMTIHPIPFTKYKIGYLPRTVHPSKQVLQFIRDYAKKSGVIFVKIEPYTQTNTKYKIQTLRIGGQKKFKSQKSNFKLIQSPHPLFPEWTQMLDLTRTEEQIMNSMKPKTRYNIRLAQKKGVIVREMSDDSGFRIFSDLYFQTCKRQHYYGHSLEYHRSIWENLRNSISHILVAFYQDTPLAAYELFYFNKVFYYTYGGTSEQHRNLMAANLLMWEAVKLGKKLGAEMFDMWGSLPPEYDQKHPWAGFTRFKEGYGTKFVKMSGSYDLIINPLLYRLYNSAYVVRQLFLKLKQ